MGMDNTRAATPVSDIGSTFRMEPGQGRFHRFPQLVEPVLRVRRPRSHSHEIPPLGEPTLVVKGLEHLSKLAAHPVAPHR